MKKSYIVIGVVIVAIIGGVVVKNKKSKVDNPLTLDSSILLNKTDTTTSTIGDVSQVVGFTGDLSPKNQTVISSEVNAKVIDVLVNEGQLVHKGQVLANLDHRDLEFALQQQQAQVDSAKANYELNLHKLERQKELYESGFISKIAYDELITNRDSALQSYNIQLEQFKRSQKQLNDTTIKAPFDGVIYQINIDNGALVSTNTKLFSIANLDILQIKTPISTDYINNIKVGDKIDFTVDAKATKYSSTVSRINPVAEDGTRSFMIYADFDNKQANLKAGQFIQGSIVLKTLTNQTVLPCDFVRHSAAHPNFVLEIADNKARIVDVKLLLKNELTNSCAVDNLAAGIKVISGNVLTVNDGDAVSIMQ